MGLNAMHQSDLWVFFGGNVDEFFVVDDSISVFISIVNHLIDFGSGEVLSNAGGDLFKLFRAESSLFIDIEVFEELSQWGFRGSVSTESEDVEEGTEVHIFSVRAGIDNAQNLSGLIFNAQGSDGVNQFFSWDVSTSVVVEDVETFLKSLDCIGFEVFVNVFVSVESLS